MNRYLVLGFILGVLATATAIALIQAITYEPLFVTQNQCRAENPGYDCGRGYVKSEPFK